MTNQWSKPGDDLLKDIPWKSFNGESYTYIRGRSVTGIWIDEMAHDGGFCVMGVQLKLGLPDPYDDWEPIETAPKCSDMVIDGVTTRGLIIRGLRWDWWSSPCNKWTRCGWGHEGSFQAPTIYRWRPA